MAISVVGQASAAATSVAIPAHAAGDMILVSARGTAAAPSVPAASGTVPAWATLQTGLANSVGLTVVSFVATAATTTTGAFTNATHICVLVLRPGAGKKLQTAVARSAVGNGNNTQTIVYPALTLNNGGGAGTSAGVRIGTRTVAVTAVGTAPASWTPQSVQPAGASALMSVHTRLALAANPTADSVSTAGTNAAYRAVTVEVEEVTPVTYFGQVSLAATFGRVTAATRTTFSAVASPVVFGAAVAGDVSGGVQTHFGATSLTLSFGKATQASRQTFGQVARQTTFGKAVAGQRKAFGVVALPVSFGKAVTGQRKTFGVVARPITFGKAVAGTASTGAVTHYGAVARATVFGKAVAGQRTAFGQVARPVTFTKAVAGQRWATGQVSLPVVFTASTSGTRAASALYGQITLAIVFGAAVRPSGWLHPAAEQDLPLTPASEAAITLAPAARATLTLTPASPETPTMPATPSDTLSLVAAETEEQ